MVQYLFSLKYTSQYHCVQMLRVLGKGSCRLQRCFTARNSLIWRWIEWRPSSLINEHPIHPSYTHLYSLPPPHLAPIYWTEARAKLSSKENQRKRRGRGRHTTCYRSPHAIFSVLIIRSRASKQTLPSVFPKSFLLYLLKKKKKYGK